MTQGACEGQRDYMIGEGVVLWHVKLSDMKRVFDHETVVLMMMFLVCRIEDMSVRGLTSGEHLRCICARNSNGGAA